jgi:CubicO group peptidase (beta-lactamase class C family)
MKNLYFILALLFISNIYSQTDKRLRGVDKDLEELLEITQAPSFAVAVVEGNKVIYAQGFGYSDFENKIFADANTLYAIGSATKAFTTSILGQLREEEDLKFEDSPIKYIPELRFYNNELNNNITITDLITHRTGIPRHDGSWYLFPTKSKDSLIQRIAYHKPFTELRKKWYYNNFMYLIQGVITERLTDKSWEDNIKERFFEPLNMTRSNVSIDEMESATNAAIGYNLLKGSNIKKIDYYRIAGMSPAGSINSSVNDMANWIKVWLNKGKFNGKEILSERYLAEAMSSHITANGSLPNKEFPDIHMENYGYAWFISSYKSHYRVEHGGNIDGFSASVALYPSDSLGIVVLTNQGGSRIPNLVRNALADRMLDVEETDWAEDFIYNKEKHAELKKEVNEPTPMEKIEGANASHNINEYTGIYSHPGYGRFRIIVKNDSLFALGKTGNNYMKHYHYDVFEPFNITDEGIDTSTSGTGNIYYEFSSNRIGEISSLKVQIEPTLDPLVFKREPNIIKTSQDLLKKYVGNYELSGIIIKIYTKESKDILYAFVSGQTEYELLATEKHQFSLKILDGYKIKFIESENGSVYALKMIQPNGTFKATKQ